jgi:Restriction endonuclease
MQWMGFTDAKRTPSGPDGGLDVVSSQAVAQVKLHGRPIGRPDLEKLQGAAAGAQAIFFAAEGYTQEAVGWAASVEMALSGSTDRENRSRSIRWLGS